MSKEEPIECVFEMGEGSSNISLNLDFNEQGSVMKRKGWKTFDGMVKVFEELNDRYKKYGYVGDFTLRLPLRRYKRKVE